MYPYTTGSPTFVPREATKSHATIFCAVGTPTKPAPRSVEAPSGRLQGRCNIHMKKRSQQELLSNHTFHHLFFFVLKFWGRQPATKNGTHKSLTTSRLMPREFLRFLNPVPVHILREYFCPTYWHYFAAILNPRPAGDMTPFSQYLLIEEAMSPKSARISS